jgi:hypothetical protein
MCSSFYKLHTLWEYPHRTLQQELATRIQENRPFALMELSSIVSSAVAGLKALQEEEIKHECLTA